MTSRASRRGVLKGGAALGIGATGLGLLGSRLAAAQAEDALEIFSWWTSPGESKALQALFDAFTAANPGVEVVNSTVAGGGGVKAKAVLQTRLQGGQPPDSWQTHVGRELVDLYVVPGSCEPITDIYESEGWTDVIPADLVEQATWESEKYSIPVGVHRGNGFFYNKSIMFVFSSRRRHTMSVDEFFAAADTLKAAGIPAL